MAYGVLSDDEISNLRKQDGNLTKEGFFRGGANTIWEGLKGASAGSLIGAPALLLGPLGVPIWGASVIAGAAGNAIWGSKQRNSDREDEAKALQQAAQIGAGNNGNLSDEEARKLAPKKSTLRGAFGSLGLGAMVGGGGMLLAGTAVLLATGSAALFGAPLLIAAAATAGVAAIHKVSKNTQANNELAETMKKTAALGGAKARVEQSKGLSTNPLLLEKDPKLAKYNVQSTRLGAMAPAAVPVGGNQPEPRGKSV